MHEFMMNCLYLLATILSMLGIAAGALVLAGFVKGVIDAISHRGGHHEG